MKAGKRRQRRFVVRQDALRSMFEAFFLVLRQEGKERDDDKDEIMALCPNQYTALKIARLLRKYEGREGREGK